MTPQALAAFATLVSFAVHGNRVELKLDRGSAELGEICKAPQMARIFSLGKIFRIFNRQKIVNEEDAFDVGPLLQPAKITWNP